MAKPEIITIHLCQNDLYDLDIEPIPMSLDENEPLDIIIKGGFDYLRTHFNDLRRRAGEKPTQALLIGEDGRTVARIEISPDSLNITVEDHAGRHANRT